MRHWLVFVGRLALALMLASPALCVGGVGSQAWAQVVSNIVVEGNQRVEAEAVTSYLQIQPGENATPDLIDESIKALFQTGLFSDVQIFRRGSSLVVRVEENPIINRVNFEGNDELDDKALVKEVELKERMIFTRARVQSDVQRLIALYRRSGMFAVRVEPKIIRLPQNRVNLVFEIDEGEKTRIESINFVGNDVFSDGTLRSVISTSTTRWWKFFSTTDNYDPDRLAYDRELLRRYYLKNGFADFRVISATAELARDGENFYITFTVEEGPEYDLAQVTVNTGDTTLDQQALQDALVVHSGQRYDATKLDKSVENITIEAGKSGYAFAKVEPDIQRDEANKTLTVVFNIQEGPRVYIERIDIVGNTRTLDEVIRREIRLVEGDAYNRVLVDRARRRLTALDFFEKIDIRETQGTAADRVVLTVELVEKSTGSINFAAGYSTVEQVIGSISITERNLLGRGQFIRLSTALSFKRQSIDFSFTEPYFLDRNVSAGFDAYATRTDQEAESSFTTEQYGGALRAGFYLNEYMRLETKYSFTYRVIDVDDPRFVSPAVASAEGTDNISLASLGYIYDDLDSPLRPTTGIRVEPSLTVAGLGGDVFYFRSELDAYYFMPLYFEGVILKLKGSAGHVEGFAGEDVSVIDRFYKGADSFRGFARAGVGPHQSNGRLGDNYEVDSIGGQTFAIGTVEVTFPLGLPPEFGLEGAVFSDFGTVFNVPEKTIPGAQGSAPGKCRGPGVCKVFDSAALRASVGAGLIWQSPFGPLRLDVAYPFLKENFDDTELVRFSVGTRF